MEKVVQNVRTQVTKVEWVFMKFKKLQKMLNQQYLERQQHRKLKKLL